MPMSAAKYPNVVNVCIPEKEGCPRSRGFRDVRLFGGEGAVLCGSFIPPTPWTQTSVRQVQGQAHRLPAESIAISFPRAWTFRHSR